MELIEEIKLSKTEVLKLYSDRCFKPGIGEYDSLDWKYINKDKEYSISAAMATSLMAAKGFKKFSGSFLKNIL